MLGFSLSVQFRQRPRPLAAPPPEIRAIITPVALDLFEGQIGADIAGIATYLDASNYFAPGGVIAPPRFRINGVERGLFEPFSSGDAVSIEVVDDGAAPDRIWVLDDQVARDNPPPPPPPVNDWSYSAITRVSVTVNDWPAAPPPPAFSYPSVTSTTLDVTF